MCFNVSVLIAWTVMGLRQIQAQRYNIEYKEEMEFEKNSINSTEP